MPAVQHTATEGLGLLLVDMQEGVLRAVPTRDVVAARCRLAVSAATLLGIPVAFSEQVPAKLGHTLPALLEAAPGAQVFAKSAFSALRAQGIDAWLEGYSIRHLLLAGIETPVCIYQTALDAAQRELPATLLTDCLGAGRPEDAASVLAFLAARTRHAFIPCERLFYSLLGSAEHPCFRDWTRLVKEARC